MRSAVGPPSPIGRPQGSSEAPNPLQEILNLHCKDYPTDRIPVGCNLVVMPGWEGVGSHLLTAGSIKPNGPQNWGSDSKQFTAACIDKLVRNEKLRLQGRDLRYDQDISTLLDIPALLGTPRVPGPEKFQLNGEEQTITVYDLLCMRSGLPEVGAITLMSGIDAETLGTEELLSRLAKHPGMVFPPGTSPPGTTHQYCITNYYLLAKIVENVSGRPFVDFVREEILTPLHMSARCSIDPDCPQTIPGYDGDPDSSTYMQDVTSPNKSYGATGLIGPPEDMKQWNAAIAQGDYGLLATPKAEDPSEKPSYCRGLSVSRVVIPMQGCQAGKTEMSFLAH
ncbi:MAG: serine hydrolase domain-containing protein [Chlamydiia bacterium]